MDRQHENTSTLYFPPLYGNVECQKCDKNHCDSRGKYQRNRRDFEVTSGRCPRLPDKRGFVDKAERELFAQSFPLIHAELGCDSIHLTLRIPGEKRSKTVYITESGYWFFKTKDDSGNPIKRVVIIETYQSKESIISHMENLSADYCLFPCTITEYTV